MQYVSPHVGAELSANGRKSLRKRVKNPAWVAVFSLNGCLAKAKMKKQNAHQETSLAYADRKTRGVWEENACHNVRK